MKKKINLEKDILDFIKLCNKKAGRPHDIADLDKLKKGIDN